MSIPLASSGPVCESNGFRERMAAAVVEWSWLAAVAGTWARRGGRAAGSADGSSATLEATSVPMPDAWK